MSFASLFQFYLTFRRFSVAVFCSSTSGASKAASVPSYYAVYEDNNKKWQRKQVWQMAWRLTVVWRERGRNIEWKITGELPRPYKSNSPIFTPKTTSQKQALADLTPDGRTAATWLGPFIEADYSEKVLDGFDGVQFHQAVRAQENRAIFLALWGQAGIGTIPAIYLGMRSGKEPGNRLGLHNKRVCASPEYFTPRDGICRQDLVLSAARNGRHRQGVLEMRTYVSWNLQVET